MASTNINRIEDIIPEGVFACTECGAQFPSKKAVDEHECDPRLVEERKLLARHIVTAPPLHLQADTPAEARELISRMPAEQPPTDEGEGA